MSTTPGVYFYSGDLVGRGDGEGGRRSVTFLYTETSVQRGEDDTPPPWDRTTNARGFGTSIRTGGDDRTREGEIDELKRSK